MVKAVCLSKDDANVILNSMYLTADTEIRRWYVNVYMCNSVFSSLNITELIHNSLPDSFTNGG